MKKKRPAKAVKGALNAKQQRFVEEYLIDPTNAAAAYRRAGYKITTDAAAKAAASRLLANAKIAAEIARRQRETSKQTEITVELVVQETWQNYQRCVEAEDFAAANKSLELLGRHVGAFPTKHVVAGAKDEPIRFVQFADAPASPPAV